MKKNIIRNILLVGLELVFVFSVFKACMSMLGMARDNASTNELVERVTSSIEASSNNDDGSEPSGEFTVNYDELLSINPNIRGWIRYTQAGVDHPVVQGADNDYYLSRDYYGNNNLVGSIFIDYRNRSLADKNVVIFGHNTWNGSMFGQLHKVLSDGFLDSAENRIIEVINTKNRARRYEIFSVYVVPEEEYYITTDFQDEAEYREFLDTVKARSQVNLTSDLTGVDNIITLSTCNDLRLTNNRLVVHAKLVEK